MEDTTELEHNERMPQIWQAISTSVEVENKRIVDLGCGGGDLVRRCNLAGAAHVVGIDRDPELVIGRKKNWKGVVRGVALAEMNINMLVVTGHQWDPPFDLAFCMSVLPYLTNWMLSLDWMHDTFPVSVIECQYLGDGPGPNELRGTTDMRFHLEKRWDRVELIGGSLVKGHGIRDIWMCET